jgi:uncharacterized protein (TIRG00374 family)
VKTKLKQGLQVAFFLALGLGFIWWFIAKLSDEELNELFNCVKNVNLFWLILAFVISILSCYVRALRWKQLLKPITNEKLCIKNLFFAIMTGYLTNLAVPRLGEIVRCAMLKKADNIAIEKSIGTVITERFVDLLLFIIIFFIALTLEFGVMWNYIKTNVETSLLEKIQFILIAGVIIVIFITIVFIIFRKRNILTLKITNNNVFLKIKSIILGLWQGIKSVIHLDKPLLFAIYSCLIWFLWIVGTWAIFQCFPDTSSLSLKVALIITLLSAFGPMITPGGIGLYPMIFAKSLYIYAVKIPVGYAAGWLSWLVSQLGMMIFGLIGFVYFSNKNAKRIK